MKPETKDALINAFLALLFGATFVFMGLDNIAKPGRFSQVTGYIFFGYAAVVVISYWHCFMKKVIVHGEKEDGQKTS